ncbi:hypothetical protein BKA70DRAFT_1045623, partial [Coprinopsis sp. MPI-PUGE-AT-0042]
LRELAQKEAQRRIFWAIEAVSLVFGIPAVAFMDVLKVCFGAVVGTCASKAMSWGQPWCSDYDGVRRLSVIVCNGYGVVFMKLLEEYGTEPWQEVVQDRMGLEDEGIHRIWETRMHNGIDIFFLRLIESTGTIMHALTSSSTTADMIAIDDTRVYLLYPKLVHRNLSWRKWVREEHRMQDGLTEDPARQPKPWRLPAGRWLVDCGRLCFGRYRLAQAESGIGVFFWNHREERGRMREAVE